MLIDRGRPEDGDRARRMLDEALPMFEHGGRSRRARECRELVARLERGR